MFGGGEEYFREPEAIDRDTLRRFAVFCARLRSLEKPGNKVVNNVSQLAREVGNSEQVFELVVGALFRHIKSWTGQKQLACWYILDKLCKDEREKYAYTASKYILDIGRDYIPYEDPALAARYESLVEHWDRVFPRHVVDALWMAKKERLWAVEHPKEVAEQQMQEEREWELEEQAMQEQDGLNDFGQPCMDYLQGRCFWGDSCRLLHPPGMEGTLPPECRTGDWKCMSCGVINRHFRRRCANCVREKPQYQKVRKASSEGVLLSAPDGAVLTVLTRQFGYDPLVPEDAVAHWKMRLQDVTLEQYLDERRAAYRTRILGKAPTTALETQTQHQKNYPDVDIGPPEDDDLGISGATKRARFESAIPQGTSPVEAIPLLARVIVERGVHDNRAPLHLYELSKAAKQASVLPDVALSPLQADTFMSACKLVYAAWSTNASGVKFAAPFFRDLRGFVSKIGLSQDHQDQVAAMCTQF